MRPLTKALHTVTAVSRVAAMLALPLTPPDCSPQYAAALARRCTADALKALGYPVEANAVAESNMDAVADQALVAACLAASLKAIQP